MPSNAELEIANLEAVAKFIRWCGDNLTLVTTFKKMTLPQKLEAITNEIESMDNKIEELEEFEENVREAIEAGTRHEYDDVVDLIKTRLKLAPEASTALAYLDSIGVSPNAIAMASVSSDDPVLAVRRYTR